MNVLIIEKQKIRGNLKQTLKRAKGSVIYAELQGDAYGLGLVETAKLCRDEGVTRFAVGQPQDGALLRKAGFQNEEILLMRSTADPREIEALLDAGLVATIGSRDAALVLSGLAKRRGTVAEAHLKIDTGLGRYGFLPNEFDKIQSVYEYMSNLAICGVYTQLNAQAGRRMVNEQVEAFREMLTRMRKEGMETGVIHAAGSAALFSFDLPRLDAVRVGTALAGRMPGKKARDLQPVGYVETPVAELRWLPKGSKIGSNEPYTCRKPTRFALLPLGVSDGIQVGRLRRGGLLGLRLGKGHVPQVTIGDTKVRVLGGVGLTHTAVDCTDVNCAVGDLARVEADPLFCGRLPRRYI